MRHSQLFASEPASVSAARRFARAIVAEAAPDAIEPVQLMVSELATNSIMHARSEFELTIVVDSETIQVEVADFSPGVPAMRAPGPDALSGRGLRIVDLLSDAWEVRETVRGKTVWFTIATAQ